ncbi:MAG: 30S ribosome-binding factor RbfA, partial [Ignavibacteriales bacterium]|nr:30S ribosome-binding factor RbfA [Ignavibacteriales bacterium]
GFLTVTEVHMTPALKLAKVYVSILGNEDIKQKTLDYLEEQKPRVRQIIGSHVRLKFTPSVQFYLDETMERVSRIEQLIKKIHEHDNEQPEGTQ